MDNLFLMRELILNHLNYYLAIFPYFFLLKSLFLLEIDNLILKKIVKKEEKILL